MREQRSRTTSKWPYLVAVRVALGLVEVLHQLEHDLVQVLLRAHAANQRQRTDPDRLVAVVEARDD